MRWPKACAPGLCAFEYRLAKVRFYGPKIEYTLKDALGRPWQCGTIQVDPNMPERLAPSMWAKMVRHRPIMLHRAIVGSLERFIGILIEQHAGALPAWLAPVQVAVLNITDAQSDYRREIAENWKSRAPAPLRVALDLRNEKITYKIREHSMQNCCLYPRRWRQGAGGWCRRSARRGNKDLGVMPVDAFIERITQAIASKT